MFHEIHTSVRKRRWKERKLGEWMAACALRRLVPRLCLRRDLTVAQQLHAKPEDAVDEQERTAAMLRSQEASLHGGYNPPAYHRSVRNAATAWSRTFTNEARLCLSTLTPSFWQQSNCYTASCLRHLSSTKTKLPDLAFSKASQPEMPNEEQHIPPNVKFDARTFLKCRPEYASISLDVNQRPPEIQWEDAVRLLREVSFQKSSMNVSDMTRLLVELGRLHPDTMPSVWGDHRFVKLLSYSTANLHRFTDLQLLEVLQSFAWQAFPPTHYILRQYETELTRRVGKMSLQQILLVADLWRCIGRRVPQFLEKLYNAVSLCRGKIDAPELVQLLYIIGEGRHFPTNLIGPLEKLLMRHLQKLEPEEVGTVCLALFKSSTSMSRYAVNEIVNKATVVVEEMSDFAMVNVIKLLRFSYLLHSAWMEAMAREIPQRAPRMGAKGLMHVALGCSALHLRNDDILAAVAESVLPLMQHCRIKDLAKLLWAFGTMGFPPSQSPNLYPSLTDHLRQKETKFKHYPEHLLTGLLGLAFVSQFPEDLIALVLSPDFVDIALKCKDLDLKKDLFTLDGTVALELPHWSGPRLSEHLREEVTDMIWNLIESDIRQKRVTQEAEHALQELLGGKQFVRKRMILPHVRSVDLEVHMDSSGKPVPVKSTSSSGMAPPKGLPKLPPHQGRDRADGGVTLTDSLLAHLTNNKKPSDPSNPSPTFEPSLHSVQPDESAKSFDGGLKLTNGVMQSLTKPSGVRSAPQDSGGATVKLAIQVNHKNHYCYMSQQLLGLHAMKRRQLKLMGYRVVELAHHDWYPMLRKTRAAKQAYLWCQIYSALD